jgi:hypothetical protein
VELTPLIAFNALVVFELILTHLSFDILYHPIGVTSLFFPRVKKLASI